MGRCDVCRRAMCFLCAHIERGKRLCPEHAPKVLTDEDMDEWRSRSDDERGSKGER